MPLTKQTFTNKFEVLANGAIQVQDATVVLEDGVPVTEAKYHRYALEPGDTLPAGIDGRIRAVAAILWTPKVIADHAAAKATAIAAANRP